MGAGVNDRAKTQSHAPLLRDCHGRDHDSGRSEKGQHTHCVGLWLMAVTVAMAIAIDHPCHCRLLPSSAQLYDFCSGL